MGSGKILLPTPSFLVHFDCNKNPIYHAIITPLVNVLQQWENVNQKSEVIIKVVWLIT